MIATAARARRIRRAPLGAGRTAIVRSGRVGRMASAPVGYDAGSSSRRDRPFPYVGGAGANRHLTATTLARMRELSRAHDRSSALM